MRRVTDHLSRIGADIKLKKNILKFIFPILFLLCMIINDYLIIYNTACFLSLFIFLFYTEGAKLKTS